MPSPAQQTKISFTICYCTQELTDYLNPAVITYDADWLYKVCVFLRFWNCNQRASMSL